MEIPPKKLKVINSATQADDQQDSDHPVELTAPRPPAAGALPVDLKIDSREEKAATLAALKKQRLINKINYLNFQDAFILVTLRHLKYNHTISLKAKPMPCQDSLLECLWKEDQHQIRLLQTYMFESLMVPDGQRLLQIYPELLEINPKGLTCRLPDTWNIITSRKVRRHTCRGIKVQLIQFSSLFNGTLLDYNAFSFKVSLQASPPQTYQWLNTESRVTVILSNENETIYSGECRIIKQTGGQRIREFVLEPVRNEIQRFKHKEYRSARQEVRPTPDVVFLHPFTRKLVNLKAVDLSGSGFAVKEELHNAVLLPGMILPQVELSFADSLRIKCKAQVVYRQLPGQGHEDGFIKCGLTILDMDANAHVALLALLQQADDNRSYICNKVDLDDLWDFFFETGFIYPDKYEYIQKHKSQIKEIYRRLYNDRPDIARHFIYQDKGLILGHMAMVRYYRNTWLIHHHAARSKASKKAGLMVLNQIGRFGNDSHRLHSMHMDFLMCYYRPDNKFPSRVFGGAVRKIKDSQGCSQDLFTYLHLKDFVADAPKASRGWELYETSREDLNELGEYYRYYSNGLMLQAFDLDGRSDGTNELTHLYQKIGFKRQRHLFSLKYHAQLKAVLIVNLSDIGLNLSDLTNAVTVIVVDPGNLSIDVLKGALEYISGCLKLHNMPVLLYPTAFAENQSIRYAKNYTLWVINMQYTDAYFRYLNRLMSFIQQNRSHASDDQL
jgi:hypothetical protein